MAQNVKWRQQTLCSALEIAVWQKRKLTGKVFQQYENRIGKFPGLVDAD